MSARVVVGLSGGVDSAVAAYLLKRQGYDVLGVFMKNWDDDDGTDQCTARQDFLDALAVADVLGIEVEAVNFAREYKERVFGYFLAEYQAGRTPNPDIMCNQEVKFRLFLDAALEDGADIIATGHYTIAENGVLKQAKDTNKDQTYFLYRISEKALQKTLFPLGEYTKPEVRQMAEARGLFTAGKKESMGICFVGQVGMREFLSQYVPTSPGDIIDKQTGATLGRHDGAIFYTLGQRHGLDVGGGLPYYVVGKDMAKNEVYVTTNLNDDNLWRREIVLQDLHWINQPPVDGQTYDIRVRHRAPLVQAEVWGNRLTLHDPQRAVTAGQSAVVYSGDICLGGGIVAMG